MNMYQGGSNGTSACWFVHSTLVDLQALSRWSVCLLTGCALAIWAVGCGSRTCDQAPIIDSAHCIPTGLHQLCVLCLHLFHVPLPFCDILGTCVA